MIKAAIIGATGYSGAVLAAILCAHKDVKITHLISKSYCGQKFSDIYKNFRGILDITLEAENISELSKEADVIFLALPHGIASKKINKEILNNTKIIDMGADFRLGDKNTYEKWYNTAHFGEGLLDCAVYGLPEWNREKIKSSRLIANPGCYATASILALAPLLKEGIIEQNEIIIDAKSGVSGAGRAQNIDSLFCECNETLKPYKIASHRHTPEIEQVLGDISGIKPVISFTPHLIPMNRGILVSAYLKPKKDISLVDIKNIYKKYYEREHFIRLLDEEAQTRYVKNSNFCDISVFKDERSSKILVFSAIDNLYKGASSQAVQNMNLMFNLDEKTSIDNPAAFL